MKITKIFLFLVLCLSSVTLAEQKEQPFNHAEMLQLCKAGTAAGCSQVGQCYRDGTGGVQADPIQSVKYSEMGCNSGDMFGCYLLGEAYEKAKGKQQDYAKAKQYYERTCSNAGFGCNNLGQLIEREKKDQKKTKADWDKIKSYNQKDCDGMLLNGCQPSTPIKGHKTGLCIYSLSGCTFIGLMYEQGAGVQQDNRKALEYYKRGCYTKKDQEACNNYKKLGGR